MPSYKNKTTKYHGRKTAFDILNRVLHGGGYSNVVMKNKFNDKKLTIDDRHTATFLVYGVLRNLTLLDSILRSKSKKGKLTLSPKMLTIGRMAIFEIVFSSGIPSYATVSEYMKLSEKHGDKKERNYLNACLRKVSKKDRSSILKKQKDIQKRMSLRYSFPEWTTDLLVNNYGFEKTSDILRSFNNPQPAYFRVNTSMLSSDELFERFVQHHLPYERCDHPSNCIYQPHGKGNFPDAEYKSGWLTPQDRSTQYVPFYVEAQKGERILDLCCGSGIKTTQLIEISDDSIDITAIDMFKHKLESLLLECERLNLKEIKLVENDIFKWKCDDYFDKVLLDAPCSGTGTIRKRPEIKYRLKPEDISSLIQIQDKLLDFAAERVVKDGFIVYSTCSILQVENSKRIELFLKRHSNFIDITKEVEKRLDINYVDMYVETTGRIFLPVDINACGAYVCVLKKTR